MGGVHTTPGDLLAARSALRWRTLGCGNSSRLIHRDVCRVELPKTAAFSASPRRSLHRYVDHPDSKVADSQSGLSAHQSLLTPRCPFMRSMHQLCWPVNNSANGYSFRPYRGGGLLLSLLLLLTGRAEIRQTAGVSVAFILVNAMVALSTNLASMGTLPAPLPIWGVAAVVGGVVGTELGARRLKGRTCGSYWLRFSRCRA